MKCWPTGRKCFCAKIGIIFLSEDNLSAYVLPHWIFFQSGLYPHFQMRLVGRAEDNRKLIALVHSTITQYLSHIYN